MGLPVGLGTDGTRVASYNPWISLYWLTTGKTVGGTQVMAKENTLDRTAALQLLTTGSASLIKEQDKKGKIKKGYYADLVILSDNYFTVADEQIKELNALLTIVDGKIVYGEGLFTAIAPAKLPVIPAWSPVNFYGGYQRK
jgi:predicted amidohydrolase YtcJ